MFRRLAIPAVLGVVLLSALPAFADEDGGTEQETVTRSCGAAADPHYSPPTATDCKTKKKFDKKKTYQSTHQTNDVKCGTKHVLVPMNPSGIQVNGNGSQSGPNGHLGVCSDGSGAAPAQGRVAFYGSTSGVKLVVDGDKNNPGPEQAAGYAIVTAGPGGASVVCGPAYASSGGTGDSDHPTGAGQSHCG